ncbi:MAG TPA: hypothetical protein VLG76_03560 [Rhabdochlamydiaceae bacterium]|nr:hypothetical protein [Rhabdochlamydiaceae bacterium]
MIEAVRLDILRKPLVNPRPLTREQALMDRIYQSIVLSPRDPAISGNSINHGYTVADWTWFQRTLCDLLGAVNVEFTAGGVVVYQAFGMPSVTYSWTAVLQMIEDYHNINHSRSIGDTKGMLLAKMAMVQDATLAAGGLAFAGYRTTAIASAVKGVAPSGFNAPTILGRVTYAFVFIGIIFFTLCYLILSAVMGVKLYHGEKFRQKLEKAANAGFVKNLKDSAAKNQLVSHQQLEFLQNRLRVDPQEILEKLHVKHGGNNELIDKELVNQLVNQELAEEALSYGSNELKKLLVRVGAEQKTDQQRRAFLSAEMGNQLPVVGLLVKQRKLEMKKEAKFARLTNKECLELVKTSARKSLSLENAQNIVSKVKKALDDNHSTYKQVIAACMAGAIFMAAGLFITSGIGAVIIAVAMVLVCAAMIKLDSDSLKNSLATEAPKKLDKTLVKISIALCIASLATVIGLVIAGLIVASPYVIVVSAILSLIWLIYNMKTLNSINEREHSTMEMIKEAIEDGVSNEEVLKLLQKLPMEAKITFKGFFDFKDPDERNAARLAAVKTMEEIADLKVMETIRLRGELSAIN